ncbi:hypothetical protein PTTG_12381 [Puccinia triticina 1-1 BBBD Race 1]|uniref:Uncharacterized protein n=2 Tax=Puccinia triticina TaxID=208348 RepID=A0A180GXP3_PUCT1|nr:uncharacterized protein PtA15_6A845 [Puccinia triticina]OAV97042.1 hypothetical protein PTTG_12381 [Puccinia triticina 1-1 BBBD Race 1]WAQ86213.1 hypothetical protein PtA15_6A845 [Puccinia triticina]WAR56097.1 hypothetical protein PtB15_6B842 [Puccinia triticina]
MISKVFLAYILFALGAIPASSVAKPTAAADAEVPGTPAGAHLSTGNVTLAPISQTPAHPATPANSTTSANISAAAGHPPANVTSGPKSGNATDTVTAPKETKTNETSAAPHAAQPNAESPPTTTCFPKSKSHGIENHHCDKALDKVVFSTNQTLDKFSSLVFVNYKTCNIHIRKPQNGTLKKVDLILMVHNLTADCHSVGGVRSQSSKVAVQIERGTKENVHDVDIPVCKKEECPLTQSDCLSAFYQLPTNFKGVFINGKAKKPFARATSGNCTVTASTTDLSDFMMSRQFVLPTMRKLVNQCGEHPGKIYLSGGTKGYNGDIWLSTRASNKDLCH